MLNPIIWNGLWRRHIKYLLFFKYKPTIYIYIFKGFII